MTDYRAEALSGINKLEVLEAGVGENDIKCGISKSELRSGLVNRLVPAGLGVVAGGPAENSPLDVTISISTIVLGANQSVCSSALHLTASFLSTVQKIDGTKAYRLDVPIFRASTLFASSRNAHADRVRERIVVLADAFLAVWRQHNPDLARSPPPVASPTPRASQPGAAIPLNRTQVQDIQRRLKELGFYSGAVDGAGGQDTRSAVSAFQAARGLRPSGDVDWETLQAIFR